MAKPPKLTQEPPSYLKNLPERTEEQQWKAIESEFEDMYDAVHRVRFEPEEDAIGSPPPENAPEEGWQRRTKPWADDGVPAEDPKVEEGIGTLDVFPWMMVPHVPGVDLNDIREMQALARELSPKLEEAIAARRDDVEFARTWGLYCGVGKTINYLLGNELGDLRAVRTAITKAESSTSKEEIDAILFAWCAEYLGRAIDCGLNRDDADDMLEAALNRLLSTTEKKSNTDLKVIHAIGKDALLELVKKGKNGSYELRSKFRGHSFAQKRFAAAMEAVEDIPLGLPVEIPEK